MTADSPTMSLNTTLAAAARRARALAERLPEEHRPNMAEEWAELLDSIEDCTDRDARSLIDTWITEMERRLATTLTHAPLEEVSAPRRSDSTRGLGRRGALTSSGGDAS